MARPADIERGMSVRDERGGRIGRVADVQGDEVVVRCGFVTRREERIPLRRLERRGSRLFLCEDGYDARLTGSGSGGLMVERDQARPGAQQGDVRITMKESAIGIDEQEGVRAWTSESELLSTSMDVERDDATREDDEDDQRPTFESGQAEHPG